MLVKNYKYSLVVDIFGKCLECKLNDYDKKKSIAK